MDKKKRAILAKKLGRLHVPLVSIGSQDSKAIKEMAKKYLEPMKKMARVEKAQIVGMEQEVTLHILEEILGGTLLDRSIEKIQLISYHFIIERILNKQIIKDLMPTKKPSSVQEEKLNSLILKTANFKGKVDYINEETNISKSATGKKVITAMNDLNRWRNDLIHKDTLSSDASKNMQKHFHLITKYFS